MCFTNVCAWASSVAVRSGGKRRRKKSIYIPQTLHSTLCNAGNIKKSEVNPVYVSDNYPDISVSNSFSGELEGGSAPARPGCTLHRHMRTGGTKIEYKKGKRQAHAVLRAQGVPRPTTHDLCPLSGALKCTPHHQPIDRTRWTDCLDHCTAASAQRTATAIPDRESIRSPY